jgi:hypothetical protein
MSWIAATLIARIVQGGAGPASVSAAGKFWNASRRMQRSMDGSSTASSSALMTSRPECADAGAVAGPVRLQVIAPLTLPAFLAIFARMSSKSNGLVM